MKTIHVLYATIVAVIVILMLVTCGSNSKIVNDLNNTPLRVVSTFPPSGGTNISTATDITVVFNEPIDSSSITILLSGLPKGAISISDSVVTLTLSNRLFQKSEYEVIILSGVKSLDGNQMDSAYTWSFTTGFAPLGEQWTQQTSPTSNQLNAIVRGPYEFLAIGGTGTMQISEDGIAWTPLAFQPSSEQLWSAFPLGDRFIVCGSPGTVIASSYIYSWTQDILGDSIVNLYDMWVDFDAIYMVGTGGSSHTDGIIVKYMAPDNWETITLGPHKIPRSITRFGDKYVVVGDSGLIYTSSDGLAWDDHSLGVTWGALEKVKWVGQTGQLIAVGSAIISSTDGINWLERTNKSTKLIHDVTWTNLAVDSVTYSLYCAVGDVGTIYTSEDGVEWTIQYSGITNNLYGIGHGLVPTRFVAVGESGIILTSY